MLQRLRLPWVPAASNGDSDDSAQTAAEAELAALQAAHGEDDLTPEAITALSEHITTLTAQVMTLMAGPTSRRQTSRV